MLAFPTNSGQMRCVGSFGDMIFGTRGRQCLIRLIFGRLDMTTRAAPKKFGQRSINLDAMSAFLRVLDMAVAVRRSDGTLTLDGEPFHNVREDAAHGVSRILVYFALAVPLLTSRAVEECLDAASANPSYDGVIESQFVLNVAGLLKPETSAFFLLDECGNADAILHAIRGLGGTILKSNVDMARVKLIQSELSSKANDSTLDAH